jgi:hypothetical protein
VTSAPACRSTVTLVEVVVIGLLLPGHFSQVMDIRYTIYTMDSRDGPLALEPGPVRYTCSGDSLREFPADVSLELTRKAAAPPAAPGS